MTDMTGNDDGHEIARVEDGCVIAMRIGFRWKTPHAKEVAHAINSAFKSGRESMRSDLRDMLGVQEKNDG